MVVGGWDFIAFDDLKSCVGRDRVEVEQGALSSFGLSGSRTQYPASPSSVSPSLILFVFLSPFLFCFLCHLGGVGLVCVFEDRVHRRP